MGAIASLYREKENMSLTCNAHLACPCHTCAPLKSATKIMCGQSEGNNANCIGRLGENTYLSVYTTS